VSGQESIETHDDSFVNKLETKIDIAFFC